VAGDRLPSLDELRAGDERAYERLVTVFSPWMKRVARKYVQSAGLAEDIVQETWLAVLRELDTFQGRSSLRTWIFQILVNQAKSAGRRERRVIAMDPLNQRVEGPRASAGWLSTGSAASVAPPEDLIIADETVRTILAAVARLPPRDARIIALRDIEGFSAPEAAERLGISTGNQRVLIHRARVRLRALLSPCAKERWQDLGADPARWQRHRLSARQDDAAVPPPRPIRPRQTGRPTAVQVSERADPASDPPSPVPAQATVSGL